MRARRLKSNRRSTSYVRGSSNQIAVRRVTCEVATDSHHDAKKKEPNQFFYMPYLLNAAFSAKSVNNKVVALIESYNNAADGIFVSLTVHEISNLV